ncbi:sulfate ABC transporter substrate-binding protein [Methylobacillus gramineus]|uniref:sulfate ABC transporter substrate-binding protein n=1 Tax=Methylobacillus gramineus TaxID=755169 RepID=UPI001CFFDF85|nr:sulfate ABC transporter substrate-binding protein [Methylobacillus gramineus]MCB5185086.1 sulfate ABC transporter substrate-binding protein [Methylobacillus gramineus]
MLKKILAIGLLTATSLAYADTTLLNVSYDVTREFYKDFNPAFAKYWKQKTGESVVVNQSHGGSSKQARSVVDGLQADIISMNQSNDIDILAERGKLIPADWQKRLPNDSSPTTSTTVFLVRKGNPKQITDWADLIKPGIKVVVPNPKTSGNGRYSYLAAWGAVIKKGGDEAKARDFVTRLFKNVPVLDTGGRGATTTFVQRSIGDVLLTFENEVFLIKKELGNDQFDVVYPSASILAENPISLVDKVVDKRKTRQVAQAYLEFHYSEEGQEIAAQHYLRPRSAAVITKHKADFKPIDLFTVDELFGGWQKAQKTHFADGGVFDQIYSSK